MFFGFENGLSWSRKCRLFLDKLLENLTFDKVLPNVTHSYIVLEHVACFDKFLRSFTCSYLILRKTNSRRMFFIIRDVHSEIFLVIRRQLIKCIFPLF